ncbi:MAG: DUF3618 domain-containing protein [Caulobacteraceae bacterium]|nr:DUF3618 domain-containing protein [Caulobacteraceae bacterium]
MTKTAAELEAEVEASRAELDQTVEALKDKMTPSALFDDLKGSVKGAGNQMLANIADKASQNPMPLLVIGAGLAWLLMDNNKRSSGRYYGESRSFADDGYQRDLYGYDEGAASGRGLRQKAADAASAVGDKVSGVAGAAQDKVSDLAGAAQDRASHLAHNARDAAASARSTASDAARAARDKLQSAAGSARDSAIDFGQQAQETFYDTLHREPLIIGALGLAVGAAIGVSLPSTSIEDERLGRYRDQLFDKGKELVQGQVDTAKQAAGAAYSSVKEELQNGDENESLADKVGRVAQAGVQSVADAVKPEGQGQGQGQGAPA